MNSISDLSHNQPSYKQNEKNQNLDKNKQQEEERKKEEPIMDINILKGEYNQINHNIMKNNKNKKKKYSSRVDPRNGRGGRGDDPEYSHPKSLFPSTKLYYFHQYHDVINLQPNNPSSSSSSSNSINQSPNLYRMNHLISSSSSPFNQLKNEKEEDPKSILKKDIEEMIIWFLKIFLCFSFVFVF